MAHNYSVKFRVIPFLLWTKGSHQSPNFDIFKCSGENLPSFSWSFSNHKLVFLQNLHNSLVSWKMILLYFSAQTLYALVTRSQLNTSFLDFWVLWPKFVKFLMSILKRQVSSSSTFVSFFIFMAHNSSVNFKVIHFLLWTKESHQSSNFDIFECSGENLPFLSCHFPNDKSVFLQVLHRYWMLWKTNPLYFFSSKKIYFAQK